MHSLALASVVSAVLSCCFPLLPAVLAIAFGIVAASEIRDRPETFTGRELAIAGVVLGTVLLLLQVAGVFVLVAMGLNPDRISAFMDTPPATVFYENTLPPEGEAYLRDGGYVAQDETILLYYDDSFMEKFAALSVLTDRRVLTVFKEVQASIALGEVAGVRYAPGSFTEDHVIHVEGADGQHLALIFSEGADVRGFAERITELVARNGGAQLRVE